MKVIKKIGIILLSTLIFTTTVYAGVNTTKIEKDAEQIKDEATQIAEDEINNIKKRHNAKTAAKWAAYGFADTLRSGVDNIKNGKDVGTKAKGVLQVACSGPNIYNIGKAIYSGGKDIADGHTEKKNVNHDKQVIHNTADRYVSEAKKMSSQVDIDKLDTQMVGTCVDAMIANKEAYQRKAEAIREAESKKVEALKNATTYVQIKEATENCRAEVKEAETQCQQKSAITNSLVEDKADKNCSEAEKKDWLRRYWWIILIVVVVIILLILLLKGKDEPEVVTTAPPPPPPTDRSLHDRMEY